MADPKRNITISFQAKGEPKLIKAINSLASAQRRLDKNNKKVATSQKLVNQRVTANTRSVSRLQSVISVYRNQMLLASFAVGLVSKAFVSLY